MPREASKRNNWEKERRERFNKTFDELGKILPSYDPTINLSRIDILKEAVNTISDFKQKINKIAESSDQNTLKDDLIKKLQERVKKLLTRNEQLVKLFKDVGIKLPRVFGTTKQFKTRLLWSNKIASQSKQKILEKSQMEKENVSSTSSESSVKAKRLPGTSATKGGTKLSKINKSPKSKKLVRKVPVSSNLLLFSRLPTVPTFNQHFVLVPNPPVVNNIRTTTLRSVPSKTTKSKKTVPQVNPALSTLGPGTLILANGNIISVGNQPQIVVPPFPLHSHSVVKHLPKTAVVTQKSDVKTPTLLRPKMCVTKTTQINKVPIPAFTSKYANTSLLLKDQQKKKTENNKKNIQSGIKRKNVVKDVTNPKKINRCDNCQKQEDFSKTDEPKTIEKEKSNVTIENTSIITTSTTKTVTETTKTSEISASDNKTSEIQIATTSVNPSFELKDNCISQKEIIKTIKPLEANLQTLNETAKAPPSVYDSCTPTNQSEVLEKVDPIITSAVSSTLPTTSCTSSVLSSTSPMVTKISSTTHEDAMKNIDINLVHSDLSNDLFASLHPGSTSPTAAFLLAFPLVSSIKVTEVIDEDNSDSQRETPTLLQIGNMDASKPSHSDTLLNLDSFPFFNAKDVCENYYNPKLDVSATDKHSEERSADDSERVSTKTVASSISVSNNTNLKNTYEVFEKSESQSVLDTKTSLNQPGKLFQKTEDQNNISDNETYTLYEQKSKGNDSNIFAQTCPNIKINSFQTPANKLSQADKDKNGVGESVDNSGAYDVVQNKLHTDCNILQNTINIDYNLTHRNVCKETVTDYHISDDVNYENYKNQTNSGKPQEHSANILFSKDISGSEFNSSKQYVRNFPISSNKIVEGTGQNIEKSAETNKIGKTYHYNQKQFIRNNQTFPNTSAAKIPEGIDQNLQPETTKVNETYHYNPKQFLQNEQHAISTFSPNSAKIDVTKVGEAFNYNLKTFLQNETHTLNNFPSNSLKISEGMGQNLENTTGVSKIREMYTYNTFSTNSVKISEGAAQNLEKVDASRTYYNPKHLPSDQNRLNSFSTNSAKMSEGTSQTVGKSKTYYNPKQFISNNHQNLSIYSSNSAKIAEKTSQNVEKSYYNTKQFIQTDQRNVTTLDTFPSNSAKISGASIEKTDGTKSYYNPKQFISNDEHNLNTFTSNSGKVPAQGLDKTDISKSYYNPKQFLSNDQNTFASNAAKILEGTVQTVEKPGATTKTYYNPKQFISNEHHNLNTFPTKLSEGPAQNLEKSSNTSKVYSFNPFDAITSSKDMNTVVGDNCVKGISNVDKERQKPTENKQIDETCTKNLDDKSCFFASNYTTTSYRPDAPKTCTYESNNRNYTNPFYTNCSYNYSDTNFNQNYYKSEAKPCYSLNYENYQEYRKTDRRNNTTKEKPTIQDKPVNWMTTEQKSQTSDCFLPSFANQSYSFTSCISTEANDINNFIDAKKTADLTEKRITWSPSKLPNFLEPTNSYFTPTLPTLVGDLALGNALPLTEPKIDSRYPKDVKRKTYDNQANFLSVSQLVNQTKTDSTPARTVSRRLSASKSKNTTKNKRFDKTVDKSPKPVNNYDVFYDQKNRSSTKNISSNYSAEALIGNQCPQEEKKFPQNANKLCSSNFLTENIVTYFTTVDDSYMNQNQNFHTYTHNSFQNNSYPTNSFIYSTPISSSYLGNTFDGTPDYSTEGIMNYCGLKDNKNSNKNDRPITKEDKTVSYANNAKKTKKVSNSNNASLEYNMLTIQGTTNSPILSDDFQSHTTFLPRTAPYPCKNSFYQKQGNDFNATPLLPFPAIGKTNIQHPEISPSLNPVGTSLTNFNLSTIFPEINKGTIPNVHSNSTKSKNSSNYLEVPFNSESKYGFTG